MFALTATSNRLRLNASMFEFLETHRGTLQALCLDYPYDAVSIGLRLLQEKLPLRCSRYARQRLTALVK